MLTLDTATSDVYWFQQGYESFAVNETLLFTNGTGHYCTTQQEDNASLNALTRASTTGLVDYNRVLVVRTASDFDKSPPSLAFEDFIASDQGGAFDVSLQALVLAGAPFVNAVTGNWSSWAAGVPSDVGNTTSIAYKRKRSLFY